MFPSIDTTDPVAVAEMVRAMFIRLYPDGDFTPIAQLFNDVTDMFGGRYLDYQAIDLGYHDFQHTLQATVCMSELALAATKPVRSRHARSINFCSG